MCLCVASQQKATTSHKPFAAMGLQKAITKRKKNENREILDARQARRRKSEWETRNEMEKESAEMMKVRERELRKGF